MGYQEADIPSAITTIWAHGGGRSDRIDYCVRQNISHRILIKMLLIHGNGLFETFLPSSYVLVGHSLMHAFIVIGIGTPQLSMGCKYVNIAKRNVDEDTF